MREYSYFRAEGASLSAIETVEESKAELKSLEDRICRKFGARYVSARFDDDNRFVIRFFDFGQAKDPPEGWVIKNRQMSYDGERQEALLAKPAPGSADEFHIVSMAGLMERAARHARLENVLGSGDMPLREMPEGRYSGSFVRSSSCEDKMKSPDDLPGRIPDTTTFMFSSNSAVRGSDPLDAVRMGESWYIRVPNKKGSEEPVFVPPDAVPVAYREMREADSAEWDRRNPPRNYYDMSWGC
ncbi:MAG: hypothetical protein EPN97_04490 [Alphaproteobacteria bacterium]|nr:MAG: hypothetical protein EPN97_04490 [Alphaproteobacteria bacterium]